MIIYILVTVLSIILFKILNMFVFFENKKTLKMFIALLPLTILSALRYDVGWDYMSIYNNGFFYINLYNMDFFTEPLFCLLIKVLYFFFKDPLSLFILMSFLTSFFFSKCYSEFSNKRTGSIYILLYFISRYYFCSLTLVRQALSMIIVLYSIKYIKEKQISKYIFFVLLASSFHFVSIIYIPFYWFLNRRLDRKKDLFIITILLPLIMVLGAFFITKTKYIKYFDSMFGNDGTILISEFLLSLIIIIFVFLNKKKMLEDKYNAILCNMQIIVLMVSVFAFIIPTADRICWYFTTSNIFLIPRILENLNERKVRIIFFIIIISAMCVVLYNQSIVGDSYEVLPYKNVIKDRHNIGIGVSER